MGVVLSDNERHGGANYGLHIYFVYIKVKLCIPPSSHQTTRSRRRGSETDKPLGIMAS